MKYTQKMNKYELMYHLSNGSLLDKFGAETRKPQTEMPQAEIPQTEMPQTPDLETNIDDSLKRWMDGDRDRDRQRKPQKQLAQQHTALPQIQGFNPPDKPYIIVLVGKSRSGKSHFLKSYILNKAMKGYFKFGLCMSGTSFTDGYDYLPKHAVKFGYDPEVLDGYLQKLRDYKERTKQEVPANFIILDDILGMLKDNDPIFVNFISTFRWTNTTLIIAVQYLNRMNALLRQNTDYAIMFGSKLKLSVEGCFNSYGQLFDTIEDFKKHFNQITSEQYTAMLYDERKDNREDNFTAVKAPAELPNVQLNF
jgi:hypothetical protein